MCMRPTTTVLATIKSEDFLYTCDGHLEDANFASRIKVTAEEIAEVKREWEERQGQGQGQGQVEQGVKQGQVEQGVKQGQVEQGVKQGQVEQGQVEQGVKQGQVKQGQGVKQVEQSQAKSAKSQAKSAKSAESLVKHEQYTLHRNFFSSKSSLRSSLLLTAPVRQAEHRRRREAAQARVLQVRLPRVPGR